MPPQMNWKHSTQMQISLPNPCLRLLTNLMLLMKFARRQISPSTWGRYIFLFVVLSLTLNTEMKEELFRCDMHDMKCILMNMVDKETKYGERVVYTMWKVDVMTSLIERHWIYQNRSPEALSADPEFCTTGIQMFLASITISIHARPVFHSI